jgi:hypothetical protein
MRFGKLSDSYIETSMEKFSDWFNKAEVFWHRRKTAGHISSILIGGFLIGLGLAILSYFNVVEQDIPFFFSIDLSFTILLIFEVFGLVFILPKSVADSLGKQFEIFSIILLRSAFKEFGEFKGMITSEDLSSEGFYYMFSDAFGALLIFLIIGAYYRVQRHERITDSEQEQQKFIAFKQILAFGIFLVFLALGIFDLYSLLISGVYEHSISTFYLFLIFTDILILLYSLRYTSRYFNIFRYSSFAFATVLIRLALSADPIINVVIGVISGLFVLGLSHAYNYFTSTTTENQSRYAQK